MGADGPGRSQPALAKLGQRGYRTEDDDLVFLGDFGGYIDGSAVRRRYDAHDRGRRAGWLFRRCGPIWLTFAAAHAFAIARGRPEDWWALAWLPATEIATEVVWTRSSAPAPADEQCWPAPRASTWA